jgi:hypothetical protein
MKSKFDRMSASYANALNSDKEDSDEDDGVKEDNMFSQDMAQQLTFSSMRQYFVSDDLEIVDEVEDDFFDDKKAVSTPITKEHEDDMKVFFISSSPQKATPTPKNY